MLKIKWLMLAVFLNFLVTFLMFPGVILLGESPTLSKSWYSVLVGYVFNWGDLLGRLLSQVYMVFGPRTVWIGILLR